MHGNLCLGLGDGSIISVVSLERKRRTYKEERGKTIEFGKPLLLLSMGQSSPPGKRLLLACGIGRRSEMAQQQFKGRRGCDEPGFTGLKRGCCFVLFLTKRIIVKFQQLAPVIPEV